MLWLWGEGVVLSLCSQGVDAGVMFGKTPAYLFDARVCFLLLFIYYLFIYYYLLFIYCYYSLMLWLWGEGVVLSLCCQGVDAGVMFGKTPAYLFDARVCFFIVIYLLLFRDLLVRTKVGKVTPMHSMLKRSLDLTFNLSSLSLLFLPPSFPS